MDNVREEYISGFPTNPSADWASATQEDKDELLIELSGSQLRFKKILARLLATGIMDNFSDFFESELKNNDVDTEEYKLAMCQAVANFCGMAMLATIPATPNRAHAKEAALWLHEAFGDTFFRMSEARWKLLYGDRQ